MDVKILNCDINIQELFKEVSLNGSGSVSLYVGTRKEISEKSALGTVTGEYCREIIQSYLAEICREVSRKFNIIHITIYYSLDVSLDKPCLAIGCLSSTYQCASEAVNNAVDLINGCKPKVACVEFSESLVDVVPADLIQVKAGLNEINQRINSFIERRRAQVNADNVRDFCCSKLSTDNSSCARVDAVKIHRKDSRSHLRIRKVVNTWGPQTASSYFESRQCNSDSTQLSENISDQNKLLQDGASKRSLSKRVMLDERLKNIEEHVGFNDDSCVDVQTRLKKIEDKILYLEGLSPEYFELWKGTPQETSNSTFKNMRKRTFSTAELANQIKQLEHNIKE